MNETLDERIERSVRTYSQYSQINQYYGTHQNTTTYDAVKWTETRSGRQNPYWLDLVRLKGEAGTAYSRRGYMKYTLGRRTAALRVEHLYNKPSGDTYAESHDMTYAYLPGSVETSSEVYNIALGNFLANVNDAISPFKGMTFLGELRDTLKMLRRPASSLRDGFSAYIKGARSNIRRYGQWNPSIREIISDSWLEYTYGWKPLLSDIRSAAEAYKAFESKRITSFVTGQSSDRMESTAPKTGDASAGNYLKFVFSDISSRDDKVRFKGEVLHEYDGILGSQAARVSELSGFRLGEFVPTLWELVPYSFIVDYFTNISEILNSISALQANLAWKSCSRWTSTTREVGYKIDEARIRAILASKGKLALHAGGTPSKFTRMDYSRTVPALKVPSLVLHLPQSKWQWVNLAALLGARK